MKAEGFGYKNAWIAVKTEDSAAVATALSLRNPRPSDWARGVAAAYEFPIGCSVFVTPPIDGWVLCVGFPLFAAVDARPPTFGAQAATWAANLGCEVQYFSTHRIVEAHAWARARPGGLERAYVYVGESGAKEWEEGLPTAEEQDLGFAFFDPSSAAAEDEGYWERQDLSHPHEDDVMALAGRWSVDPSSLDQREVGTELGLVGDYGEPPPDPPVTAAVPPARPWWRLW